MKNKYFSDNPRHYQMWNKVKPEVVKEVIGFSFNRGHV